MCVCERTRNTGRDLSGELLQVSKNDCRDEEENVTMKREWRERGNRVGDVGGEGPKEEKITPPFILRRERC